MSKVKIVTKNNQRFYEIDGRKCPSVTTVLSFFEDKSFLNDWKSIPGNEKKSRDSLNRGKRIHRYLELVLKQNVKELDKCKICLTDDDWKYIKLYQAYLESFTPLYLEHKVGYFREVEGSTIGAGGTFDALVQLRDNIALKEKGTKNSEEKNIELPNTKFIVDYKNVSKQNNLYYYIKYFLQVAAYTAFFNFQDELKLRVNQAIVVVNSGHTIKYLYVKPRLLSLYFSMFQDLLFYYSKKSDTRKDATQFFKDMIREKLNVSYKNNYYILDNNFMPQNVILFPTVTNETN
jgi:hypothetical protein